MRQTGSLELDVSEERALEACRAAFAAFGWEVVEADGLRLCAIEVPLRLPCTRLPAEIEVQVRPVSQGRTIVAIDGSAAGIGASRQVEGYMAALEKRIRTQLN
jgi:hypothetical protein